MTDRPLIVAIDGPAGAGKSTVARRVAAALGIDYLDTGALYRALAFHLHSAGIPPVESGAMRTALSRLSLELRGDTILLNGEDIGAVIRSPFVDSIVSLYAALPLVREALLAIQREQGRRGLVADGRDMGTVVFPTADVKIYLTASDEERARRRFLERTARGEDAHFDDVLSVIRERDKIDSGRSVAPLKKADDAVEIDTDGLTVEDVERAVLGVIANRRRAEARSR
ncbi:MAG TPA: (d)CMP kinase [Synergistaceae bacterium]|nr:(d)CMP kinase [Synergistaceae bacterium]